jgi:hypothetical protein
MMASQATMSASSRLAAAKAGKEATIRKIAQAEDLRRQALLQGKEDVAVEADHYLTELRLALRRREDEIELLPPLIALEQQHARRPPDPADGRRLLAEKERRYRALRVRRWNELNAETQTELDSLPIEIGELKKHIELTERMNA